MAPPIEPPDPLIPLDLLAAVSRPTVRWEDNHLVDTTDGGRVLSFALADSTWSLKVDGGYAIDQRSYETLVGARDPRPDGTYTAASGAHYSLQPTSREGGEKWAVAVRAPFAA